MAPSVFYFMFFEFIYNFTVSVSNRVHCVFWPFFINLILFFLNFFFRIILSFYLAKPAPKGGTEEVERILLILMKQFPTLI